MEEAKGLTPGEKGSVMHFVMQHLELGAMKRLLEKGAGGAEIAGEVRSQTFRMVEEEFLTPQEAEAVNERRIAGFFLPVWVKGCWRLRL